MDPEHISKVEIARLRSTQRGEASFGGASSLRLLDVRSLI